VERKRKRNWNFPTKEYFPSQTFHFVMVRSFLFSFWFLYNYPFQHCFSLIRSRSFSNLFPIVCFLVPSLQYSTCYFECKAHLRKKWQIISRKANKFLTKKIPLMKYCYINLLTKNGFGDLRVRMKVFFFLKNVLLLKQLCVNFLAILQHQFHFWLQNTWNTF